MAIPRYENLNVFILPGTQPGHHRIRLEIDSQDPYPPEERPFDWESLETSLKRIEDDTSDKEDLRYVGRKLYDSLFSDEATAFLINSSCHLKSVAETKAQYK
jgi:hypothetical protein